MVLGRCILPQQVGLPSQRHCSLTLHNPADEIDAIGKARSNGPTDSGTQEREQGLLQLLTEMDGFYQDDKVGSNP